MVKLFVLALTFYSEILNGTARNCGGKTWHDVSELDLKILQLGGKSFRYLEV